MNEPDRALVVACLPAYNEEHSIGRVLLQTEKHVDRIIVCDDGSQDMTAEIAERLGAEVVSHTRNLGYGAALRSLFTKALEIEADVIVTLDADGQHLARDIPVITAPVIKGEADVCIGSRFLEAENRIPRYRKEGIRLLTRVTSAATGLELTDAQSGFRAYSGDILSSLIPTEQGMGAGAEILQKAAELNAGISEVPTSVSYDMAETSSQSPIYHALDVLGSTIKHVSIRHPLLFYGLPALVFMALGIGFGVWALQIYAATTQLITNIALVSVASFMIGLILAATAIILFTVISVVRES
jgi:glycosyltransferase involved in cell wall biosynthesis